jgi:hypothetical protein
MSTFAPASISLNSRSLGLKFFIVLLLALVMSISGFFVEGLTSERADNRGVLAASTEHPTEQPKTVLGIRLADSYRSIRRSLHYITLFLGLVFLTYFLFEVLTGKSVHPAQYALVGIAQTIFYLLLLFSRAPRLRSQLPDCGRIHHRTLLDQHRVGLPQPQTGPPVAGRVHQPLRIHLRTIACRSLCPTSWRHHELRRRRRRYVHHAQCRLVWNRRATTAQLRQRSRRF